MTALIGTQGGGAALTTLIDRPFVLHVIEALVDAGIEHIVLAAASDRTRFTALLGSGSRWGCQISVVSAVGAAMEVPEPTLIGSAETLPLLTPALLGEAAELTLPSGVATGWRIPARGAHAGRELPRRSVAGCLSVRTTRELLVAQRTLLEDGFGSVPACAAAGVHIARSAVVHRSARLTGPVWIGPHCRVGAEVVIGQNVAIGEGCVIERGTVLQEARLAPGTYVGAGLDLVGVSVEPGRISHAGWETSVPVTDPFLIGPAAWGGMPRVDIASCGVDSATGL